MGSPSLPSGSHPPTAAYYRARQDAGAPLDLTLRHCLCCKGRSGAESTIHCCSWKLAISYLLHRPACTVQCTIETLLYYVTCTSLFFLTLFAKNSWRLICSFCKNSNVLLIAVIRYLNLCSIKKAHKVGPWQSLQKQIRTHSPRLSDCSAMSFRFVYLHK